MLAGAYPIMPGLCCFFSATLTTPSRFRYLTSTLRNPFVTEQLSIIIVKCQAQKLDNTSQKGATGTLEQSQRQTLYLQAAAPVI